MRAATSRLDAQIAPRAAKIFRPVSFPARDPRASARAPLDEPSPSRSRADDSFSRIPAPDRRSDDEEINVEEVKMDSGFGSVIVVDNLPRFRR